MNNMNNMTNSPQDNTIQGAIIIIDINKLPEEIREKFPKDLQDKLMELLSQNQNDIKTQDKMSNRLDNKPTVKSSGLFTVQQGYVIGNIYKDNILLNEKPVQK